MPIVTKLTPLALAVPLVAVLAVPASSEETPKATAPKAAAPKAAKAAAPKAAGDAVAIIGGVPITAAKFEELAGPRLFAIRTQEYTQKRALLEDAIDSMVLEKEAKARGMSAEELVRVEVDSKVPAVTEAEQKEFYEKNKARFGQTPEADALKNIENGLRQQRARDRRMAYVKELRDKADVQVLLDAPRLDVSLGDDPVKGPAAAPITIVEFSDFQCPYCARVNPTLKQIEEKYADKVRVVFRDFPLAQIHKDAAKAAEAGECAHEQGKFWEMHDKLFANQSKLQVEGLKQTATEVGLDAEKFNQCLDSSKYAAEVQKDVDEGARYGVTGTPAFFINGRMLSGAQPLQAFTDVIEEELARAQPSAAAARGTK
jgi:protein-disulfide isomerase